jgi:hypothetical protein
MLENAFRLAKKETMSCCKSKANNNRKNLVVAKTNHPKRFWL